MAQTALALSFANPTVEVSVNGTVWTDISGMLTALKTENGERKTAETDTADGDTPIITKGKRTGKKITVTTVFTEGVSDAYETVRAAHEAGSALYVRWSPKPTATGVFLFTSDAGVVTECPQPEGEVNSAEAILTEWVLHTPKITKGLRA